MDASEFAVVEAVDSSDPVPNAVDVCSSDLDLGDCLVNNIVVTCCLVPNPLQAMGDESLSYRQNACESRFRPLMRIKFYGVTGTCLVFRAGSCVFVGINRVDVVPLVTQMLKVYIARSTGTSFAVRDVMVRNIVGDGFLGKSLDLKKMAEENPETCIYHPEVFPGCRVYVQGSVNAYASGKFVCAGEPTPEKFLKVVERFKKLAGKYTIEP